MRGPSRPIRIAIAIPVLAFVCYRGWQFVTLIPYRAWYLIGAFLMLIAVVSRLNWKLAKPNGRA
jgi:hypothetical protein